MASETLLKKSIVVAVIDSGIDFSVEKIHNSALKCTGFRMTEEGLIIEDNKVKTSHEHGTIISLIIKQLCKDVSFISVNILDERLKSDGRILVHALTKTIEYMPDIIHLSLGTTKWRYKRRLRKLVRLAYAKNILIVSAADNAGYKSYPAYLKEVIGVKGYNFRNYKDYGLKKDFFYAPYTTNQINEISKFENSSMIGNSMAAAYITGHLSKIKYENYGQPNSLIIKYLKANAKSL